VITYFRKIKTTAFKECAPAQVHSAQHLSAYYESRYNWRRT